MKFSLIDLAGSENAKKSNLNANQMKECTHINKSLSTLSNVINKIANKE